MASEKPSTSDLEAALHSVIDDTAEAVAAEPADQLNSVRIQQLTTLRRGAIRSRSWYLIGTIVAYVAAIELVFKTVQYIRYEHNWGLWPSIFVLGAIGSGTAGRFFLRRCIQFHREIQMPMLDDPATPPDFSTLGDGSQQWKNLEEMR
jgi:hypothetical protein